ncbi:MAG: DUF1844 domain-containing protein [bacterium]|nr:DUF1844 domain-containing protein [bacterium]MDD5528467.1 DUF1844 domain-containing protein [bacterium]
MDETNNTLNEIPEASFIGIILFLATIASQHLGLVKNPLSDKVEKDIRLAKYSIDSLEILKDKTKNNLAKEESDLLENILSELKLAYIKVEADGNTKNNPPISL